MHRTFSIIPKLVRAAPKPGRLLGVLALLLALAPPSFGQQAVPTGRWEGEIGVPKRPIVFLADFDTRQGWLGIASGTPLALHELQSEDGALGFELRLEKETVRFRGRNEAGGLKGTAVVVDTAGKTLLESGFLLHRLEELPPVRTREDAWRQDLDVVLARFLPYDRSFSDGAREEFRRRIAELKESVADRSDAEMMVELGRAVALGGNAHTRLYLVRNRTEVRRLPVRVWSFRDGLHVVRATDEHADLLGCRVEGIGTMNAAAAAGRVSGIKPGNASWQRYMSSYMLTSPEILAGSGITADPESVPLALDCSGQKVERVLAPLPLARSAAPVESWWDLSPLTARSGATPRSALAPERTPLYLRKPDVHYWFEHLPEERILYFQYNRSAQMEEGPSLEDFSRELLQAAERSDVEALVVDLRFNTGGNLYLATAMMERLRDAMAGKKVFVVTGRATFSAGISHAAQWKEWGATVVGEPVGDDLDMWAEGGNVELPHSKLTVHYANGFHGYSQLDYPARRPYFLDLDVSTLEPDLPVDAAWAEYAGGRDPALERIRAKVAP